MNKDNATNDQNGIKVKYSITFIILLNSALLTRRKHAFDWAHVIMRAFFICALHVRLMSIDHAVLLQFVWHSREGLTQTEREQDVVDPFVEHVHSNLARVN